MVRMVLTDGQWSRIEPHCLGKRDDPGRSGMNNRLFLEAALWKARTGSAWRDLAEIFGKWNTVFKRFNDWSAKGVFKRIFKALSDVPDTEYAMMDADDCSRSRSRSWRKRGAQNQVIGRSKGGWTTKILALTDAFIFGTVQLGFKFGTIYARF